MLIADHLPRALDALSAFTIHDSRLYLYHSTYHPVQIRNSPPSGNNIRRAATWECVLAFLSIFFPTHSLRFSFLSFFFPFCFDEILAIYDLDDGRPRSRNRTNNLHFHGKIECHRTSTSIEFRRFHIFHFISFPSFLPTPSSIPSRSSVRIELSFNHANTPSATIKLRSSLLRNYLTSTNQLTCCRERESFEAGICISFVRRKVSKYLCGIVTWLPFTCDLSSSPNQDSIV